MNAAPMPMLQFDGSCRAIIFDLDGTLIDSAPDLTAALGQALHEVGLPAHTEPAVRQMIGEGQRVLVERAVFRAGGDLQLVDQVLSRFRRFYSDRLVEKTVLYPKVRETLAALAERFPLAIATNKPGDWARRIILAFGLHEHFRFVRGEDDVGARKPDPRLLLSLCQELAVAPAQVLMVGDSAIDVATAAAAGTRMAFCTYGFADADTLDKAQNNADGNAVLGSAERPYVLQSISDLLPLLQN